MAVNWLKTPTVGRYLEVKPKKFVGDSCLRIRALGCSLGMAVDLYSKISLIFPLAI